MNKWTKIPDDRTIRKTAQALTRNRIETFIVKNGVEAKKKFLELVPEDSEVFVNTSQTLDELGITKVVDESGRYVSLHKKSESLPYETPEDKRNFRKFRSAPEWAAGSVHAVTVDGHVMMASASGSQIPGYAYGADHVIWVIGAQKLVHNIDEGIRRIYEHSLPLEDARAKKAYGEGSSVRKILIVNNDKTPGRIKAIIVKEVLGF